MINDELQKIFNAEKRIEISAEFAEVREALTFPDFGSVRASLTSANSALISILFSALKIFSVLDTGPSLVNFFLLGGLNSICYSDVDHVLEE
jgi:hypothetical protein